MCRTGVRGDGRLCSLHVTADEEYISRLVHKIRATVARARGGVRLQRSPRKPAAASVFVPEKEKHCLVTRLRLLLLFAASVTSVLLTDNISGGM